VNCVFPTQQQTGNCTSLEALTVIGQYGTVGMFVCLQVIKKAREISRFSGPWGGLSRPIPQPRFVIDGVP
jgi:hypothetical protein